MANSIANKQFLAIARGDMKVQRLDVKWQVTRVSAVSALCLGCQIVGTHDLIVFSGDHEWRVCRVCGRLFENNMITDYLLFGDGNFHRVGGERL